MSVWNKVLVGLIFCASLVFFYTAARMVKTHKYWRELEQQFSDKLEALKEQDRKLVEADELEDKTFGIQRSQAELQRMLINRGRVWEKCEPQKVDAKTGQVSVNIDPATPNLTGKMVVYVFEDPEGAKGGRYVGEFKVTDVGDHSVQLAPTESLLDSELKRVASSKGPWLIYELMPVDRHDVFADLSDEEKKGLLPEVSVVEYLKDGQTAQAGDPKECVVDGKYQRRLRDYKEIFKTCRAERTLYVDMVAALQRDAQYLTEAYDDARKQVQFAEQEVAVLRSDKATALKEEKAVVQHRANLQAMLARLQEIVAQRIKDNLALAASIAKIQLDAAQRIDERTRTMAQAGAGAN